jgi:hypothetical protein
VRKHAKTTKKSAKKYGRLSLTTVIVAVGILAIGAVAIGAVSMGSRPQPEVKQASNPERKTQAANKAGKNFVTVKMAGQDIQVDGQTGQIKQLTPDEARKLAAGLKQLVNNKSVEGRPEVYHDDGSSSIDLEDRFQNVTLAKIDEDGNLVQACVDNVKAAAVFFGLDPKLIEDAVVTPKKPTRATPNRN